MSLPVYKIETYTGAVLDHTITSDAIVSFKDILTDGIGHFSFSVPTKKNGGYYYNDIALGDKVKIWMGYNSVSGDPNFVGYINDISAPLTVEGGYIRILSGFNQGIILLNRQKKNKYYNGVAVNTIISGWATDLGLAGTKQDDPVDSTAVILEIKTKNYFDLLREISDYWYDADTQIKKDFYVDVDNYLVWKARPIRTADVETLTIGDNIKDYKVSRSRKPVFNYITVYGFAEKPLPADKDGWTETLTNWSATEGALSLSEDEKVGTKAILCTAEEIGNLTFKRVFDRVTIRNINQLSLWNASNIAPSTCQVRLLAPDTTNYFQADIDNELGTWFFSTFSLGPDQVYDATTNPNGKWTEEEGSPNWWDIQGIQFQLVGVGENDWVSVDGIYFYPERWEGSANDGSTGINRKDYEVTDDKLHSDSDCNKRAQTLLYQMKDAPVQLDVTTPLNMNILIGDRIPMTIPAENISAENFDVVAVEHAFVPQALTKATMIKPILVGETEYGNIREPIETDPLRSIIALKRMVRQLGREERGIT